MYRVMACYRGRTIVLETFEKRYDAKLFASFPQFAENWRECVMPKDMFIKEVNCKNLGKTDPFAEDDIEMPF